MLLQFTDLEQHLFVYKEHMTPLKSVMPNQKCRNAGQERDGTAQIPDMLTDTSTQRLNPGTCKKF